jgi:hypothetical protein
MTNTSQNTPNSRTANSFSSVGRLGNSLVTLGKTIFTVGGAGLSSPNTDVVESYNETSKRWTIVPFRLSQPKRHLDALAVPASLFNKFQAGCQGVL